MVDTLARQFAGRAVFVEQSVDVPVGNRFNRFLAAYGTGTAYLPLVLVDSGHRLLTGDQPAIALQSAVNTELARPALAEIRAYARRAGSAVRVYATLHNTSGTTLSDANHAALFALVYEDVRVGVTGRFVLAAPLLNLTIPVPAGGYVNATLDTPALTGASWDVLHTVVAADYVPGPGTAYDMLQAAVAGPVALNVAPPAAIVGVDSAHPGDRSIPITLEGPYPLSWTATADVPWLTAVPDAGAMNTAPALAVSAARLAAGSQEGHLTFSASSADGMTFTQFVTVTAVLGPRAVQVLAPAVAPGAELALPVEVTALGDEHTVAFSLAFDPAFLVDPTVTAGGAAAGATVTADTSLVADGRLGVTVALPPGQTLAGGMSEVAVVTFTAAGSVPRQTTAVTFADAPVTRALADAFGSALPATFADATLRFPWWSAPHVVRRHLAAR